MKLLPTKAPVVLTALALACVAQTSRADQVVTIGLAAPLTGFISHIGKDIQFGAQLAVADINAKGLVVGGQPIKLKLQSEDDAADPRTATQVAQKLVDNGVVAVVGHFNSGASIVASKIYNDAGITEISPGSTNPTYTLQGFKTTYRVLATDALQGPALADFASSNLSAKTVAIVDDSTVAGQGLADAFATTAQKNGIKVLSRDATNDKATDFRALLTKIKGERPDIIMYAGNDGQGGPFAKQASQLQVSAKILGGDGICTEEMPKLAGDAVQNVYCTIPGMPLQAMNGGSDFARRFEQQFHQPVQLYAPFAYDSVQIIVAAMKRANSTKPDAILAQMPKTDYAGFLGRTQFDTRGDLVHPVLTLYGFKSNQKEQVRILKY